jgi:hypothetical protein
MKRAVSWLLLVLLALPAVAHEATFCAAQLAKCEKSAIDDPCPERERRICELEHAICTAPADAKDSARARYWEFREKSTCLVRNWTT